MYYRCHSLKLLCAGCNHPAIHTQKKTGQGEKRRRSLKTARPRRWYGSAMSSHQARAYSSGWKAWDVSLSVQRAPSHIALAVTQCSSLAAAVCHTHGRLWLMLYTAHIPGGEKF